MSSPAIAVSQAPSDRMVIPPIWKKLPMILAVIGAVGGAAGILTPSLTKQFAHSYLLAFMFFLSICLGGLFLTLIQGQGGASESFGDFVQ